MTVALSAEQFTLALDNTYSQSFLSIKAAATPCSAHANSDAAKQDVLERSSLL